MVASAKQGGVRPGAATAGAGDGGGRVSIGVGGTRLGVGWGAWRQEGVGSAQVPSSGLAWTAVYSGGDRLKGRVARF